MTNTAPDLKSHDTTVTRLILILTKLDEGLRPTQNELAEEFGVSLRTIQRDIGRLCYFPIEKTQEGELYFSEGFSLKRTSFQEIEMVLLSLSLSMVTDVSPQFSKHAHSLLSKLLVPNFSTPYLIKQDPFEPIDIDSSKMNDLEFVIKNNRYTEITILNNSYAVEPYKIVSFDEIWYLFAKDLKDNKIKTFFISDIIKIDYTTKTFLPNKAIDTILSNVNTAWFEDGAQFEVKVKVLKPIAHYFKKKKHLVSQNILNEYQDGSLDISFHVSSDEEVDNLIKAWLPHIIVLSPIRIKNKITTDIKEYLKQLEVVPKIS